MMMFVTMPMAVLMAVAMFILLLVVMMMLMFTILDMHVELRSGNATPLLPRNVEVICVQLQLLQRMFQFVSIHPKVDQCTDEHIAADTAENIQIKRLHFISVRRRRAH